MLGRGAKRGGVFSSCGWSVESRPPSSAAAHSPKFDSPSQLAEVAGHRCAQLRTIPVFRRLTTLLVIFAALVGGIGSAYACASPAHDCCPPGSTGPCDHGGKTRHAVAPAVDCCLTGPASTSSLLAISSVSQAGDAKKSLGPTSPGLSITWLSAARAPPEQLALVSDQLVHSCNASLTYLRTGRLRL
jgi:hypothetical protein